MHRLLVTGSRDWTDGGAILCALLLHGPGIVVHGGARGADRLAAAQAVALGWPPEAHPADWRIGRHAGMLRNQVMVDLGAEVCLAFPLETSRGTWDCVRRADRADIPVVIWADPPGRWWRITRGDEVAALVVLEGRVAEASRSHSDTVDRPWSEVKATLAASGWHGAPGGIVREGVPAPGARRDGRGHSR